MAGGGDTSMEFRFGLTGEESFTTVAEGAGAMADALERLRSVAGEGIGGNLAEGFADLPEQIGGAIDKIQTSINKLGSGSNLSGIGREIGSGFRELQTLLDRLNAPAPQRREIILGIETTIRQARELLDIVRQIGEVKPQVIGSVTGALNQARDRNISYASGNTIDGEVLRSQTELVDGTQRQLEAVRRTTQNEQALGQATERVTRERNTEADEIAQRRAQQPAPFSHPQESAPATPRTGAPAATPFLPQEPAPATPRTGAPAASPFLPSGAPLPAVPAPPAPPTTDPFQPVEQNLTQAAEKLNEAATAFDQAAFERRAADAAAHEEHLNDHKGRDEESGRRRGANGRFLANDPPLTEPSPWGEPAVDAAGRLRGPDGRFRPKEQAPKAQAPEVLYASPEEMLRHRDTESVGNWDEFKSDPKERARIDELKRSIATAGVQEPLDLRTAGSASVLYDGHHRLAAAEELGLDQVPYTTREETSKRRVRSVQEAADARDKAEAFDPYVNPANDERRWPSNDMGGEPATDEITAAAKRLEQNLTHALDQAADALPHAAEQIDTNHPKRRPQELRDSAEETFTPAQVTKGGEVDLETLAQQAKGRRRATPPVTPAPAAPPENPLSAGMARYFEQFPGGLAGPRSRLGSPPPMPTFPSPEELRERALRTLVDQRPPAPEAEGDGEPLSARARGRRQIPQRDNLGRVIPPENQGFSEAEITKQLAIEVRKAQEAYNADTAAIREHAKTVADNTAAQRNEGADRATRVSAGQQKIADDEAAKTQTGGSGGGSGKPPRTGVSSGFPDPNHPNYIAATELSLQEVVDAARTRDRGITQVGNSSAYIIPEQEGVYRYQHEATKDSLPGFNQVVDPDELQRLANSTRPYQLGVQGEQYLGQFRDINHTMLRGFNPDETREDQYNLANRVRADQASKGGEFTPVGNSTTLFRDLNEQLIKVTQDLATYNLTIRDQIAADKALSEVELRRAETERGQNINAGLPGFEQVGGSRSKYFNTPEGALAYQRSDGRASLVGTESSPAVQRGAVEAQQADARIAQERQTAEQAYGEALRRNTRLYNIEQLNPAQDGLRSLGNGYVQYGRVLQKQTEDGFRDLESSRELYEARIALARSLDRQSPHGFGSQNIAQSFLGGAFGHGFESNQEFKPQDALKNLAGTAGVLARYGGEGRLLFGGVSELGQIVTQFEGYQKAMIDLRAAQEALRTEGAETVNTQVSLGSATKIAAEYGLNQVDAITAGTAGLKAFSEEIKNGASANDVFAKSVQAAGVAAVLTGQQVAQIQPVQQGIANEFGLGYQGLDRVNDSVANAARHFNVDPGRIFTGVQDAGDLADVQGFDPERLSATVGAVDEYTGRDSGAQVTRELSQGGSTRFRTAIAQLGVQYNAEDLPGTLEKAGEAYSKLDNAQKASFATQLGGARTAEVVIALLQQQQKIAETTADGYRDQGKALQEAHDKQATFAGELTQLRALMQGLATDLGKLGFVQAFGGVLELLSPIITALDDMAKVLDHIPGSARGLAFSGLALGGLAVAGGGSLRNFGRTAAVTGYDEELGYNDPARSARTNVRRGLRSAIGRDPNGPASSRRYPGGAPEDEAANAHSAGVQRDTAATTTHTEAIVQDTAAITGEAEAKATEVKATAENAEAQALGAKAAAAKTEADTLGAAAADKKAAADLLGARTGGFPGAIVNPQAEAGLLTRGLGRVGLSGVGPGGLLGAGLLATFGYGAVKSTYEKTSGILDTRDKAQSAAENSNYSGSSEDLRQQASDSNTAAQQAAMASGGVFGTILNALTGGNGSQIKQARDAAAAQSDLATELDKIRQDASDQGVAGSLDISSPDSLNNSLKALQATGAGTATVVTALQGALDNLATAGSGAVGRLNPTDVKELSARAGTSAKGALGSTISLANDEGLTEDHSILGTGVHWKDLTGVGAVADLAKYAGGKAGGIDNIVPEIGSATGTTKQRRESAKHDLKKLKGMKPEDQAKLQEVASQAVQDYLSDNPSYDPNKDMSSLTDYIDQMIAQVPGLGDGDVDPNTRHHIAETIAQTVRGAANDKVSGTNATSGTVQAAFNDKVTADAARAGTVGDLASVGKIVDGTQAGDTAATATARSKLAGDQKALSDAMAWRGADGKGLSADQIEDDEAKVAEDQVALNSSLNAQISDQIRINQSHRALSDALGRGADNLSGLQQQIANATNNHDRALAQAAWDDAAKQQDVLTTQTQAAGISVGINNAQTGAATGKAASYDPRDELGNAQHTLGGDQLTFSQIDTAEKGLAQHSQDWINAFKKVQEDKHDIAVIELNNANAAIDAAELPGDAVGAAADAVAKAKARLAAAKPGTAEYNSAQAGLNAANYSVGQTNADYLNAQNALSAAPGDDVAAAGVAAGNAHNKLDADTKYGKDGKLTVQYMQDLNAYRQALYAAGQAIVTEAAAEATAKVFPGDAIAAAQAQISNAQASLAVDAYHSAKWWQDYGALQQGKAALARAEEDAAANREILAGDSTDPVYTAKVAADKARQKLENDRKAGAPQDVLDADTVAERGAQNAQQRAGFDQFLSDTKINMELGRTSFATYMQLLEGRDSMLKAERARMKVGSDGYRQLTDEINTTEQTIHDAMNQLSGQFNLGDIKMPTLYEVRRSNATAQAGQAYSDNRTVSIVINGVGSTQEVVQIVKQQLGTAATVTRGTTTARKV
jgi:hypothetical protein